MSVRTYVFFITSVDLANTAKNNESEKSAGTFRERDLLTSKGK
jgi:hypothetical protein